MKRSEIESLFENELRRAVERSDLPPRPDPICATPWVAMSLLQKAVRRGRRDLALRAAATLRRDAPERLWRRLGCIASEDVGLGDLDAVGLVTAALAGSRFRAALGGEWAVANCVIDALARAPKCRAADDLLMACERRPAYAQDRAELRALPTRELIAIASRPGPVHRRALALWCALGGGSRALGLRRRGEAQRVFDDLRHAGWPERIVEIARLGRRRTGELLGPFVALLYRELAGPTGVKADERPPETMIGGTPSWAYDLYSREGRAAFARFLRSDAASAAWLRGRVDPGRRVAFFGHIVFRVEGGLVDHRMRWPLADQLRREADVECSGPECRDASEILALARADIPRLNEARAEVLGEARHAAVPF